MFVKLHAALARLINVPAGIQVHKLSLGDFALQPERRYLGCRLTATGIPFLYFSLQLEFSTRLNGCATVESLYNLLMGL